MLNLLKDTENTKEDISVSMEKSIKEIEQMTKRNIIYIEKFLLYLGIFY